MRFEGVVSMNHIVAGAFDIFGIGYGYVGIYLKNLRHRFADNADITLNSSFELKVTKINLILLRPLSKEEFNLIEDII